MAIFYGLKIGVHIKNAGENPASNVVWMVCLINLIYFIIRLKACLGKLIFQAGRPFSIAQVH